MEAEKNRKFYLLLKSNVDIAHDANDVEYDINNFISSNIDLRKKYRVRAVRFGFTANAGIIEKFLCVHLPNFINTGAGCFVQQGNGGIPCDSLLTLDKATNGNEYNFTATNDTDFYEGYFNNTNAFKVHFSVLGAGITLNAGVNYFLKLQFEEM